MHLVFVYNADAGLFSMLTDYAHKIVSPQTYACSLCALTYGNLGMKRAWKRFVTGLDATIEFLHRDELAERYGVRDVPLPAVFRPAAAGLEGGLSFGSGSVRLMINLSAYALFPEMTAFQLDPNLAMVIAF